jgi:DNA replication factor GINS
MYDELFAAWRFEVENDKLGALSPDFYARMADYVRRIKEERRMLDKKAVKVRLLERELSNVQRIVDELVWARYRKLIRLLTESQKAPADLLAAEEAELCEGCLSVIEAYQSFAKKLLQGQVSEVAVAKHRKVHKRVALRFLKDIPAIVGVDMKTYGPFLAEDVGSVHIENAKILIKKGLAEAVEVP